MNEWEEPGWAMVGMLRDAKPKRGARMRGRTGSCTVRQGVVKSRGRKIKGAERPYPLVLFFFSLFFLFVIMRSLFLGTKSLMQR